MPSRTATATASGSSKASKKDAQGKTVSGNRRVMGRKSNALDPTLLATDSDEDGEGPQESDTAPAKTSKATTKAKPASRKLVPSSSRPAQDDASTRRSTRLSGDNLPEDVGSVVQAAIASVTGNSNSPPAARISPRRKPATNGTTNKRKATSADPVDSRRPTTSQSVAHATEHAPSHKTSKASTNKPNPNKKPRKEPSPEPAPPPAMPSDSDDSFTFVRIDDAPSASHAVPEASSSKRTDAPPKPKPPKGTKKLAASARAVPPTSADVLASGRKASPPPFKASNSKSVSSAASSLKSAQPQAKEDRKGKRRADDLDTAPVDEPAASAKPQTKKGRTGYSRSKESQQDQNKPPGTPPQTISVPVYTQETPAIQRNAAMRSGAGTGTPGSSRRSSGDLRGRRGSSIGNGFEALPHPSIATDTLYKHIKADDPPAIRFRTLTTWCMHRLADTLEERTSSSPAALRQKASEVVNALITDLAEKRIDLSWEEDRSAPDYTHLPPHPQNISNRAKLDACNAWSTRLRAEDDARNARINEYKKMTETITRLAAPPLPAETEDDLLQPDWSVPLPQKEGLSQSEMLVFGERLLKPSKRAVADRDVVKVEEETGYKLDGLRPQAAELHQLAHRLDRFLHISNAFLDKHLEDSYRTLSQATRAQTSREDADGARGSAFQGDARPSRGNVRDLLRAISRADAGSRA